MAAISKGLCINTGMAARLSLPAQAVHMKVAQAKPAGSVQVTAEGHSQGPMTIDADTKCRVQFPAPYYLQDQLMSQRPAGFEVRLYSPAGSGVMKTWREVLTYAKVPIPAYLEPGRSSQRRAEFA